jgi:hypothetical protein
MVALNAPSEEAGTFVATTKVAVRLPAAIVTVAGTITREVLDDTLTNTVVRAAQLSVIDPFPVPPAYRVGGSVTDCGTGPG